MFKIINKRHAVFLQIIVFHLFSNSIYGQNKDLSLIPEPFSVRQSNGTFALTSTTVITYSNVADSGLANLMRDRLNMVTGYELKAMVSSKKTNAVRFLISESWNHDLKNEGYILKVGKNTVDIIANKPSGWFYGMQTFFQLLPPEIDSAPDSKVRPPLEIPGLKSYWRVPAVDIIDYPRFEWRGLMLDVSRHFFSKQVVKNYIDQMVKYKLNMFHWHLTDNQGWRIEIKSLPKLTEVGAWRVPRTGYWTGFKNPQPGEEPTHGGYYTQEDVREIVAYASKRFVTIVPEIDVPGHSLALIASYPHISCTGTPQKVLAGDPWDISRTNIVCVGNDSSYVLLDRVFGEVASLFPGEYIHIGGDEVSMSSKIWDKCMKCQRRIKDEHLRSTDGLQSYFLKRVAAIVESKGKKVIGWYEDLEGGMPENTAVMSWKDTKGGVLSSQKGHKVVMTPAFFTYLDFYQGDPLLENGPFTVARLRDFYRFDPVPKGADRKLIMGGQGSLWTEQVSNERKVQYMTWPRGMALSEVLWSDSAKRNWPVFINKMKTHLKRFDYAGVNYATAFYEPIISAVKVKDGTLQVVIDTEVEGLEVYYSFDDDHPDQYYPKYNGTPLSIPNGAHHIRVVSYENGRRVGREINLPLAELLKRVKPMR